MKQHEPLRQILIFLGITTVLTLSVELFMLLFQPPEAAKEYEYFILGITWSPAIAAIVTKKLFHQDSSEFGWQWTQARYPLMSYFIPLGYSLAAYLLIWSTGFGKFYNPQTFHTLASNYGLSQLPTPVSMTGIILFSATFGWLHGCLLALGEEIGWRGFLVPMLFKIFSFRKTAILSGLIWAIWHYPVVISGHYNGGAPIPYSLVCFTLLLMCISIPLAWLRLKSGSLWTGVIFHSSHNLFILDLWNPLTQDTGITRYLSSEFGIALVITSFFVAWFFWKKADSIPQNTSNLSATKA
jgi:uncharacterized protein